MTPDAPGADEPSAGVDPVEGPSFPAPMKLGATVLMGSVFAWGALALDDLAWSSLGAQGWLFLALVGGVIGSGWWAVVTGHTRIDAREIRQTWLWSKSVPLAEITQLKLVQVRGLEALFVPRLVVRSRGLGVTTFHAGNPALVAAFRRLAYGED